MLEEISFEIQLKLASNKFLVNMVTDATWAIQSFEIIAVKWFMELSKKVIEVVKNVISHLWEMCE